MPYYRITIYINYRNKPLQGVRLIETKNPDIAYSMVQQKVFTKIRPEKVSKIEVVMLPKQSEEVRRLLASLKKNQDIYLNN